MKRRARRRGSRGRVTAKEPRHERTLTSLPTRWRCVAGTHVPAFVERGGGEAGRRGSTRLLGTTAGTRRIESLALSAEFGCAGRLERSDRVRAAVHDPSVKASAESSTPRGELSPVFHHRHAPCGGDPRDDAAGDLGAFTRAPGSISARDRWARFRSRPPAPCRRGP